MAELTRHWFGWTLSVAALGRKTVELPVQSFWAPFGVRPPARLLRHEDQQCPFCETHVGILHHVMWGCSHYSRPPELEHLDIH